MIKSWYTVLRVTTYWSINQSINQHQTINLRSMFDLQLAVRRVMSSPSAPAGSRRCWSANPTSARRRRVQGVVQRWLLLISVVLRGCDSHHQRGTFGIHLKVILKMFKNHKFIQSLKKIKFCTIWHKNGKLGRRKALNPYNFYSKIVHFLPILSKF